MTVMIEEGGEFSAADRGAQFFSGGVWRTASRYEQFHHGGYERDRDADEGNPEVRAIAHAYNARVGLPPPRDVKASLTDAEGRALATAYQRAVHTTRDASTQAAYAAFNREVAAQYADLVAAGYKVEPWMRPGQPYANSREMRDDVRNNRHLWYFRTEEGGEGHPIITNEENDRFRAVHDVFGHAKGGNQFGPKGETAAFVAHQQMFSPHARRAMATETIGQNAYVNWGPHSHIPAAERPFADQKAMLLNPGLYEPVIRRSLREEGAERSRDFRTLRHHPDARVARAHRR